MKVQGAPRISWFIISPTSARDVQTRMRYDIDLVNKLFVSLLPSFEPEGIKTFRVGKQQSGKARPLKVILKNQSHVAICMNNFYAVSAARVDHSFSSIQVSRDRTPRECKHLLALNFELEDRSCKVKIC